MRNTLQLVRARLAFATFHREMPKPTGFPAGELDSRKLLDGDFFGREPPCGPKFISILCLRSTRRGGRGGEELLHFR